MKNTTYHCDRCGEQMNKRTVDMEIKNYPLNFPHKDTEFRKVGRKVLELRVGTFDQKGSYRLEEVTTEYADLCDCCLLEFRTWWESNNLCGPDKPRA